MPKKKIIEEFDYEGNPHEEEIVHSFQSKQVNWLGWMSLFIVVLAVTSGAWFGYDMREKMKTADTNIFRLHGNLVKTGEILQGLESQLAQQDEQVVQVVDRSIKQYIDYFNTLEKQIKIPERYFYLRETAQGLQIAQWLLEYQKDIKSAKGLLETLFTRIDNIRFIPVTVKTALKHDIDALDKVAEVDRIRIIKTIEELSKQIPSLPLRSRVSEYKKEAPGIDASSRADGLYDRFTKLFKKIVVIKKRDQSVKPLINEDNQDILTQNIQLLLRQASLEIIQRNSSVYSETIQLSKDWVMEYYDLGDAKSMEVVAMLDSLLAENVDFEVPTLDFSIKVVNEALVEQRE